MKDRLRDNAFKEKEMRKEREALLVAALAGLVIVGAAAFVVQPTLASKQGTVQVQLSNAAVLGGSQFAIAKAG
jgi:hypothetical protein